MSGSNNSNNSSTVYVGNLDEKVNERVLYDILIQAGRVLELYIPKDKETDKPKGYAFAEYESHQIADYAVKLFSGLVILYNRPLKFAISGQDRASQNVTNGIKARPYSGSVNNVDYAHNQSMRLSESCRVSAYPFNHSQVPVSPGVTHHHNGYGSQFNGLNYDNGIGRRVFGSSFDNNVSRSRSRRYDSSNPSLYSSY